MFELIARLKLGSIFRYFLSVMFLVDGTDKFFNLLTFWPQYLWAFVPHLFGSSSQTLMYPLGVIEFLVGCVLWVSGLWGGIVAFVLLAGISLDLLFSWRFLNIALVDGALAVAALALAQSELPEPEAELLPDDREQFLANAGSRLSDYYKSDEPSSEDGDSETAAAEKTETKSQA